MRWLAGLLAAGVVVAAQGAAAAPSPPRFDERAAFAFLRQQVELGPRPAGSATSRRLAAMLHARLPNARYGAVPGGLRNVIGVVPGREQGRVVVVGAHYDTKDIPRFVGANDNASGVAIALQLARTIRPRTVGPTLVFVFFDGEESPRAHDHLPFEEAGLRGSRVAAPAFRHAEAMILLDLVGDRSLAIPREANSDARLWAQLRDAARRAGKLSAFPNRTRGPILDDHLPFIRAGVPSIDVIDLDFPCWHRLCDDMNAVSARSLDAVGETMLVFLRGL